MPTAFRSLFLLAVLFSAAILSAREPVFVYLFRHAEKVDESRDPDLSPAGLERARALVAFFEELPVDAIFATELKRTQQTVEPLARAKNLPLTIHPAKDSAGLAESLRTMAGQTILVSGHSNTIPEIIEHLGGPGLSMDDYDDLFLVVLIDGEAHLQHFRFHMD